MRPAAVLAGSVFGSAGPAVRGDVEGDAVGTGVLHPAEAAALGGLAHPVGAAGRLDRFTRARYVVDDEAEVVHAGERAAALARVLLLLVVQEREVHHPAGEINAVGAVPVRAPDALEAERLLVELGRLFRVRHRNRDVS